MDSTGYLVFSQLQTLVVVILWCCLGVFSDRKVSQLYLLLPHWPLDVAQLSADGARGDLTELPLVTTERRRPRRAPVTWSTTCATVLSVCQ